MNHDAIAVHVFSKIVIDFIKTLSKNISKIYYFSDGAPQQYKNYKHFINLYYHKQDHGIQAEWHFFATAHGKGPRDGIGSTVKRMAARASLPHDRQITTPQEFYEWASQSVNLPQIKIRFSSKENYDLMKAELLDRFNSANTIPETQKIHCVIPSTNGIIKVKRFSVN